MIIVDELKRRPWRFKMACHCASTKYGLAGVQELLSFATNDLGLKPDYLQCSRRRIYHFDLNEGKRLLAIKHGAEPVSCKEFVRLVKRDRATGS